MDNKNRARIIRKFLSTLQESLIEKLPQVPEHWNGRELRQWIVDSANAQLTEPLSGARLESYQNDRATFDL
jgi:hypothetical protein